jgi:transglutaminase-like putative cysteine protease
VRSFRILLLVIAVLPVTPWVARAQFGQPEAEPTKGPRLGAESVHRYQVGVIIEAVRGPCRGVFITVPVPTQWPEQEPIIVDEEFSSSVRGPTYRSLHPGLKQMLVAVPSLPYGGTAKALVTYEVHRRSILPPDDPSVFEIPKRLDSKVRPYLGASVYINPRHRTMISLAREITKNKETAWEQVEAIFDYVRDNVEHRTTDTRKGTLPALTDGFAGNHDLTSVFVGLCRAHKVPARMVWVAGHCYAEFYLHDDERKGHWIPCQVAGTRHFGEYPIQSTIMQKGDNFKVPEKKDRLPYVSEYITGQKVRGTAKPRVTFVRGGQDEPPEPAFAAPPLGGFFAPKPEDS